MCTFYSFLPAIFLISSSGTTSTFGFVNRTQSGTRRNAISRIISSFLSTAQDKKLFMQRQMHKQVRIGFVGDVMIGRGIDAILPFSVDGTLHESYVKDAKGYVTLATRENGPINQSELASKGSSYIWGDVIDEIRSPDALVINLETALTTSNDWAKDKSINYRSHPNNVASLLSAGVDVATLANNHVLDWGKDGLKDTVSALQNAGIHTSGAGISIEEATKPTFFQIKPKDETCTTGNSKMEVEAVTAAIVAVGFPSAGVPMSWKAGKDKCGVNVEHEPSMAVAEKIVGSVNKSAAQCGYSPDIVIVSLHWGSNWGWGTPSQWRAFAHHLIDLGVDFVVGHSSHHVKGMEIYKGKFISYGLGDFINDYEGIVGQGYENFRHDLSCLYIPSFDLEKRQVVKVDIIPCKIKNLKVQRAKEVRDISWLQNAFNREGSSLGTSCDIHPSSDDTINLQLVWTANSSK